MAATLFDSELCVATEKTNWDLEVKRARVAEVFVNFGIDLISSQLTGAMFRGINESTKSAVSSLLSKIPDAIKAEEGCLWWFIGEKFLLGCSC